MQVGLAVDDIKSVQEKAALKKEALQVNQIKGRGKQRERKDKSKLKAA